MSGLDHTYHVMDDHEHMYSDGDNGHNVAIVPPTETLLRGVLETIPEMYPLVCHVERWYAGWDPSHMDYYITMKRTHQR